MIPASIRSVIPSIAHAAIFPLSLAGDILFRCEQIVFHAVRDAEPLCRCEITMNWPLVSFASGLNLSATVPFVISLAARKLTAPQSHMPAAISLRPPWYNPLRSR